VCLLEREIGEYLGIPIERGSEMTLATLTGTLRAYGHEIILETLGFRFETLAYFPDVGAQKGDLLNDQLAVVALGDTEVDRFRQLFLETRRQVPQQGLTRRL
jgi:hypothetical protein